MDERGPPPPRAGPDDAGTPPLNAGDEPRPRDRILPKDRPPPWAEDDKTPLPLASQEAGPPAQLVGQLRPHLDEAVRLLRELVKEDPRAAYRHLLAQCLRERSGLTRMPEGRVESKQDLDEAIKLLAQLRSEFKNVPQYTFDLCEAYAARRPDRGPRSGMRADPQYEKEIVDAVQMMEELTRERPGIPSYTFALAHLYFIRCLLDHEDDRPRDAMDSLDTAIELQQDLARKFPSVESYVVTAAVYELEKARMPMPGRRVEEAESSVRSALQRLESLASEQQAKPHISRLTREGREVLSHILQREGRDDEAHTLLRKLAEERLPVNPASRPGF